MTIVRFETVPGTTTASQVIAQAAAMKSLFFANRDVLMAVQVGFICNFGEWVDTCARSTTSLTRPTSSTRWWTLTPTSAQLGFTRSTRERRCLGTSRRRRKQTS